MSLRELLSQKRSPILKRWLDLIAASQPAGKSPVKTNKDPFSNPEGYTLNLETEAIFCELIQEKMDINRICSSMENIIRIKAVQDISPGQAISFIFLCKEAIMEEVMLDIMYETPSKSNIKECVISEAVVRKQEEPKLVRVSRKRSA